MEVRRRKRRKRRTRRVMGKRGRRREMREEGILLKIWEGGEADDADCLSQCYGSSTTG